MAILDLLKMLFSKETRETVTEILKLIKTSPEWRKDLVILDENFAFNEKERILVLQRYIKELLSAKIWPPENIQKTNFILRELTNNAFEHGLKQKPKGEIRLRVELSSEFFKISVTDPGPGFDLAEELKRQGAEDRRSETCRALGFIYRMATDISQDVSEYMHTISATLQRSYAPCEIEKIDNITIFRFQGDTPPYGFFWAEVVRQIQELSPGSNVILDFSNVDEIGSRVISRITLMLYRSESREERQLPSHMVSVPEPKDFLTTLSESQGKELTVVVCGCGKVNEILREFLETRFRVFRNKIQALEYFRTS